MIANPPSWAQSLLTMVVPRKNRDGIAGDLLEEYHEVQLSRRGRAGADGWYIRQVLLFLWRAARWWGLALGALIVMRDALDVYVPTQEYYARSVWTTYSAVAVYLASGIQAGWSSRRMASGTVVGISAAVIASIIGLTAPLLFLATMPGLDASSQAGIAEALDVPAPFLLIFGAVFATLGAAVSRGGTGRGATWG